MRGDLGKAPLDVTLSDARGGWKGSSVQRSVCRGRGDAAREPLGDGAELVHVEGVPQAPERLRPDGGLGTAKSPPTWQGCSSEGEGGKHASHCSHANLPWREETLRIFLPVE